MVVEKRYQVFVSSTFEDLKEERQEVMRALLLELDCFPAGMELFQAADDDQWTLIQSVIDSCDYYIVILGARYGSVGPDGLSYTEMEYRYALDQKKPILGFVHQDPESIPVRKAEKTPENAEKLKEFRKLVQKKTIKKWSSAEQLGGLVSRSLVQLMRRKPGVGWIRGDQASSPEQLLRLRAQLEDLERELATARTAPPAGAEEFQQGADPFAASFTYSYQHYVDSYDCTEIYTLPWDSWFRVLAPSMLDETSEEEMKATLRDFIAANSIDQVMEEVREEHPSARKFRGFHIIREDFETILVQLMALNLITKSERKRTVKDTATY